MFSEQMKGIAPALPLLPMQPPLQGSSPEMQGEDSWDIGFVHSAHRGRWDTLSAQSKRESKGTWLGMESVGEGSRGFSKGWLAAPAFLQTQRRAWWSRSPLHCRPMSSGHGSRVGGSGLPAPLTGGAPGTGIQGARGSEAGEGERER